MSENELCHHGVLGMKWGVRRFQNANGTLTAAGKQKYQQYKSDRKDIRSTTRHVSAGAKNLKIRAKNQDVDMNSYLDAKKNLRKVSGKLYAPWHQKQKRMDIQTATDKVVSAEKVWERTKSELNRAERIYDSDVSELRKKAAKMVKTYGAGSVKDIQTKEKSIGKNYVKNLVKTGVTVANLPIIGNKYTARYIDKKDYADREKRMDDRLDRYY